MKKSKNESDYKVLSELDKNPNLTQRELAKKVNFSLGKANYVLEALYKRGLIKLDNFRKSGNKSGYAYILTPKGIKEKIVITKKFLNEKVNEYEKLEKEIKDLKNIVKKEK
tara:strand:+ start:3503 stop:3835 length:333 start_codon:yes stop_codon:yes gene_type:complete